MIKKDEYATLTALKIGQNTFKRKIRMLDPGGTYFLIIETPDERATQKIIVAL